MKIYNYDVLTNMQILCIYLYVLFMYNFKHYHEPHM